MDLSKAYFQIIVDEEHVKYLTIRTLEGLYRLNRLPFGMKVTSTIFQQIMDTLLIDLGFTIAYLDNILIKNESREHAKQIFKK